MISVDVPGRANLQLQFCVFDFNGTLALDGGLREGVAERLRRLSTQLELHVMTGDTFGTARTALAGLPVKLTIAPQEDQAQSKLRFLQGLGAERTAAVGNGANDRLMLAEAALGIAVIGAEGAAAAAVSGADIVCLSIADALDLLIHPRRLVATLRL